MHWILQDQFHSQPGRDALIEALERFAISYSVHEVVPRIGELKPEPEVAHRNVICLGSYSLRPAVAKYGWTPGLFDVFAQGFEEQLAHWGNHLLNAGSNVCAVSEAAFKDDVMFVRPVNDSKYFAGRVFGATEFAAWQKAICSRSENHGAGLSADSRIQVAPLVEILAEYRFWIVKGEVVTQSVYRRGGLTFYSNQVDERLAQFVQERVKERLPHETFVMDVCDTSAGMKIVEVNTLNSSAFYAADVQQLVLALEEGYGQ